MGQDADLAAVCRVNQRTGPSSGADFPLKANRDFYPVDKKNKKYFNFKAVCKMVSIPVEEMAGMIADAHGKVDMGIRNRKTGRHFRVRVVSKTADGDYLMELYDEVGSEHGQPGIIFRNWVSTARPKKALVNLGDQITKIYQCRKCVILLCFGGTIWTMGA